jgi:ribosomal protein L16 Arg81 hydroxylase
MPDSNASSILERFFPALSRRDFLQELRRRNRHRVAHGDLARLAELPAIDALRDLDAALAAYRSAVMVYGAAIVEETEGIANRMMVPAAAARRYHDRGCTLELDCADLYIPALRPWIAALQAELELPAGTFAKAIVYASPGGSGLGPHFDAYDNFIIQLRGRKVWHLLANQNAAWPLMHYDLDEQPYLPEELRGYWRGTAPRDFAAEAEALELAPGSVLFLPRGTWHATAASDEVMSVNVTFSVPSWIDLLLAEIRRRLAPYEAWRRSVDGCTSSAPEQLAELAAAAGALLRGLPGDLGELRAEDLIARHREPHDAYQLASALFRQGLRI